MPVDRLREAFETNTLGAYRMTQALAPAMRERGYGRIVNVSSGMGQLTDMYGGHAAYRLSKTALNALTRIFATSSPHGSPRQLGLPRLGANGHGRAERAPPRSRRARTIVWAATLPDDGPTGGFFRYRKPIPW